MSAPGDATHYTLRALAERCHDLDREARLHDRVLQTLTQRGAPELTSRFGIGADPPARPPATGSTAAGTARPTPRCTASSSPECDSSNPRLTTSNAAPPKAKKTSLPLDNHRSINALAETTIGLYKTECVREGSPFRRGPLATLADLEQAPRPGWPGTTPTGSCTASTDAHPLKPRPTITLRPTRPTRPHTRTEMCLKPGTPHHAHDSVTDSRSHDRGKSVCWTWCHQRLDGLTSRDR
jgi:hypothetical protein